MAHSHKKTATKALIVLGEVLCAMGIAWALKDPKYVLLAPAFEYLLDWFKHKE